MFTFSRLILNGIFPGTEIGVFSKIVLFSIVFFNVASTKSSNIAGILSFGGLLGLIRKRLVEFRLDFLAFIRIDQILTSPSLVDIPPVFVFVQSLRQALLILVLLVQKMATECFLGPTAISYAGWAMLYNEE